VSRRAFNFRACRARSSRDTNGKRRRPPWPGIFRIQCLGSMYRQEAPRCRYRAPIGSLPRYGSACARRFAPVPGGPRSGQHSPGELGEEAVKRISREGTCRNLWGPWCCVYQIAAAQSMLGPNPVGGVPVAGVPIAPVQWVKCNGPYDRREVVHPSLTPSFSSPLTHPTLPPLTKGRNKTQENREQRHSAQGQRASWAQRKPIIAFRSDGTFPVRLAERRLRGICIHPPPRSTLNWPVEDPWGFWTGLTS